MLARRNPRNLQWKARGQIAGAIHAPGGSRRWVLTSTASRDFAALTSPPINRDADLSEALLEEA